MKAKRSSPIQASKYSSPKTKKGDHDNLMMMMMYANTQMTDGLTPACDAANWILGFISAVFLHSCCSLERRLLRYQPSSILLHLLPLPFALFSCSPSSSITSIIIVICSLQWHATATARIKQYQHQHQHDYRHSMEGLLHFLAGCLYHHHHRVLLLLRDNLQAVLLPLLRTTRSKTRTRRRKKNQNQLQVRWLRS